MKQRTKAFLVGVGSVVSLYPATNYAAFIPRESAQERMRGHWESVGGHLRASMKQEQDEQKKARK
jgi:hypothetical protein